MKKWYKHIFRPAVPHPLFLARAEGYRRSGAASGSKPQVCILCSELEPEVTGRAASLSHWALCARPAIDSAPMRCYDPPSDAEGTLSFVPEFSPSVKPSQHHIGVLSTGGVTKARSAAGMFLSIPNFFSPPWKPQEHYSGAPSTGGIILVKIIFSICSCWSLFFAGTLMPRSGTQLIYPVM